MQRIRQLVRLACALPLLGLVSGCIQSTTQNAGSFAEQIQTFVGDFAREVLAVLLT